LNFMVDPEGRAYEVRVIERAGDEAFIAAAQQALEKTEFEPAKVGEQAVNGSTTHMYRSVMERSGPPGARRVFASRYRRFMEALEEQSQAEAADRQQ
jgi:TonB family protein